jgi:hypothetical protein
MGPFLTDDEERAALRAITDAPRAATSAPTKAVQPKSATTPSGPGRKPTASQAAAKAIKTTLADGQWHLWADCIEAAQAHLSDLKTIRAARKRLGLESEMRGRNLWVQLTPTVGKTR